MCACCVFLSAYLCYGAGLDSVCVCGWIFLLRKSWWAEKGWLCLRAPVKVHETNHTSIKRREALCLPSNKPLPIFSNTRAPIHTRTNPLKAKWPARRSRGKHGQYPGRTHPGLCFLPISSSVLYASLARNKVNAIPPLCVTSL